MPTMGGPKTICSVPECDSGQRQARPADNVHPGPQVYRLGEGKLYRTVRVVRQNRLAGGGHAPIDHPGLPLLAEAHSVRKLVYAEDAFTDVGWIRPWGLPAAQADRVADAWQ
jgi:hypothetical protein